MPQAIGFIENIAFAGVTLVWEAQDIGLAFGILGSFRGLGGAIAQALYTSILTNELNKNLPKYIAAAAKDTDLPSSSIDYLLATITAGDISTAPGINYNISAAVDSALKSVYTSSFQTIFYTMIPFLAVLLFSSMFVPNMEVFLSGKVAKKLQGRFGGGGGGGAQEMQEATQHA
ncbi:hypothetical protein EsH8_VIII_000851 [Colletotrichum jinshuiense]